MIIQKISCPKDSKNLPDTLTCFNTLKGSNANLRCVDHVDQNHYLWFDSDFDASGNNVTLKGTDLSKIQTLAKT